MGSRLRFGLAATRAETLLVGRTNYTILAMGLAGVLCLSLLMKYFLQRTDERQRSPVAQELMSVFGHRLDEPAALQLQEKGKDRVAVVTVSPMLGVGAEQLCREVGEYVWRRLGEEQQLTVVEVECRPFGSEVAARYPIARPYTSRARAIEKEPRALPASGVPPAPAPRAAAAPSPK